MEQAEQAARELREGLEKLRRVVTDHRDRMAGTAPAHETAVNDVAGDAAAGQGGADNFR